MSEMSGKFVHYFEPSPVFKALAPSPMLSSMYSIPAKSSSPSQTGLRSLEVLLFG
jgi:hypothetical protein